MAYDYQLCGWIEICSDNFDEIIERIEEIRRDYERRGESILAGYMDGWTWKNPVCSWNPFIFYGSRVNNKGLSLFESVLKELATMVHEGSGFFNAQGEDERYNIRYRLINDHLSIESDAEPLVTE